MALTNRQKLNLSLNWGAHFASLGIMFFLTPFVISSIGLVEYGIWSLLTVITGYMGILDMGIRSSTGRYIMLYLGKDDHKLVDDTIRTSATLFLLIGVVLVIAGASLGRFVPVVFTTIPSDYQYDIWLYMPILAMNIWLSAQRAILNSVLAAHERFDLVQSVNLGLLILKAILTLVFLHLGYGLQALVFIAFAVGVVATIVAYFMARSIYRPLRFYPLVLTKARVKELYSYGIAAFICTVGFQVIRESDTVLVGYFISIEAVSIYVIAGMLISYSWGFVEQIGVTLFPAIQRFASKGEIEKVKDLYFSQIKISILFSTPVFMGFIVFGDSFIQLWVGEAFAQSFHVLVILSAAKLVFLLTAGMWSVLGAMGYIAFNAKIIAIEALSNIVLSIVFVSVFNQGMTGIAMGTLLAVSVTTAIFCPIYFCRIMNIGFADFMLNVALKLFVSTAILFGLFYFADSVVDTHSWLSFFAVVIVAGVLGFAFIAIYLFGLRQVWQRFSAFFPN